MASLGKIIKDDRHPTWLVDSIILSAVVYSPKPADELKLMEREYGLPSTANYEFIPDEVLPCRGTNDVSDALVDLNFMQRTMTLLPGAAHGGFLDRARSIPLEYFRRLLIRGERLVLTGHSLGGAVASLLTLRLLESTGKWCHDQVQCYTFGCPFFADYRLARYINKRYKRHLVHIVSRNDIVPKVMPVAFTIYTIWAGLGVGPFRELMHLTRVALLFAQVLKVKPKKLPFVVAGTQAMTWLPSLLRFLLHRTLALALSHQSGSGYAFAGHMVLLDTETNFLEYADMERWKMGNHLSFHMNMGSMEGVKEHSLLSYIDHVFGVESIKQATRMQDMDVFAALRQHEEGGDDPSNPKVEVCTTTLNVKWPKGKKAQKQLLLQKKEAKGPLGHKKTLISRSLTMRPELEQKPSAKALKSRVACLIFARRMDETHPKRFRMQKQQRGLLKQVGRSFHSITKFVHRFDGLFLASSVICIGAQLKLWLF
uniref:Fungal lipase-type domain-containing protein n=1 Tax=Physcomitrium patens TaxID=3218 RepID=A0A7I4FU34_PHYPA